MRRSHSRHISGAQGCIPDEDVLIKSIESIKSIDLLGFLVMALIHRAEWTSNKAWDWAPLFIINSPA